MGSTVPNTTRARARAPTPRVLLAESTRSSTDPRLRTMAKILEFLVELVDAKLAVFYAVDHHLRYGPEPAVAHAAPPRAFDVSRVLRRYAGLIGATSAFAPRFAGPDVRVLTVQELSPADRRIVQSVPNTPVTPRAALYLHDLGRIVAAISVMRPAGSPDLSIADAGALRRAHPVFEEAYALARGASAAAAANERVTRVRFTTREREVAELLSLAATNNEIAEILQISRNTVKIHVRNLLAKLGVANRRQAMVMLGVAQPPGGFRES